MSEYQEFLAERDEIDYLIQQGYQIIGVTENLSGAFVEFSRTKKKVTEYERLHIKTAEARKYFSYLIIQQYTAT
ncbi:hypothetical protein [Bacillus alkalicellulosilyticus]|uniref:hypothetical protein n=1 Tax=Alkalihalobacterium alkalicellulosilyticum TaxID=1912214 RepID=UPI000997D41D|nr:hypothetical protein [Bacillus alkalicellulosilyticus]